MQELDTINHLKKVLPRLKEYRTDLATDLKKIFTHRAKRFKDEISIDEFSLIDRHINELKPFIMNPQINNKIYIISDTENILLIALGISASKIKQLIKITSDEEQFDLPIKHISTLYIIKKSNISFCTDLYPDELHSLTEYFSEKNLIPPLDLNDPRYPDYGFDFL